MKISIDSNSRFLAQRDIPAPFIATIDRTTLDATLRNPDVLHFVDDQLKPFPLNVTNRRIIVAAYGNESDLWHDKQIEIFVDPTIPNPRDPSRPGGIKVRIPTARPIAPQTTMKPPAPSNPTAAADVAKSLDGMRRSQDADNLEQWARWSKEIVGQTDTQRGQLEGAYHAAKARLTRPLPGANAARRQPAQT